MTQQLLDLEQTAGARLGEIFGVDLPLDFGDSDREIEALRSGCGLLDAGFRSLLRAVGEDRVSFLQGMLSNDVAKLAAGSWMDATHLTVQGRIVADLRVYALTDEFWLDIPVQRKQALRDALEKFIVADDIELLNDDVAPLIGLEGPTSPAILASLVGDHTPLPAGTHREARFADASVRIVAVSHGHGSGFLICGPEAVAAALWQRARELGAVPVGMRAIDVYRIDAGVPWYGCDMDDAFLAPEAGLASSISFSKGCYLGQEVVERATARGQLQKKLVGLSGVGREAPERGTRLVHAGDDVGWITSAARTAGDGRVVALAYVRRSAWGVGTELQVPGVDATLRIDDRVPSLV